jgi:O-antigen/teichoic acid export membrane protein
LNIILIPYFGISGSVIASISSFMILVIVLYLFSKKEYFFEYEWFKLLKIITVYAVINVTFLYISTDTIYLFILKILPIILFPVILYFTGFYEKIELERISGFTKKYIFRNNK